MPILDTNSLEFISRSTEHTRRVGMRLGALLNTGDVICLVGDLGAGKTTFVQGIAAGWGSLDRVTSPTFVLVNVYRRPEGGRLYHLDAYRLDSPAEAEDLDLQPMLESGPLVVEWADRIKSVLPRYHLWVTMQLISIGQRDMVFTGHGNRYLPLMAAFRKQLYGGQ
jgi:tRNA threonylcarbamoyladenosine biosynthesis protein TsaE